MRASCSNQGSTDLPAVRGPHSSVHDVSEFLTVVKDLMGHASIKQTEIYAHLAPARSKGAVAVLERGNKADVVPFRKE